MSTEPTAEEIERVRAWEKRTQAAQWATSQRIEAERNAAVLDPLTTRLVGHRIIEVGGELSYGDWRVLRLTLSSGDVLTVGVEPWGDPPELSVEVAEPKGTR